MARLGGSPTVQTLAVMAVVFLGQQVAGLIGAMGFSSCSDRPSRSDRGHC